MIVHLPADATVVGSLRLYSTEARDTTPAEITLTALGGGAWSGDAVGLTGRYYPQITFSLNGTESTVPLTFVDLPENPDLLISPEVLGKKAGLTLPLTEDQRDLLTDAILDAQSDVTAYLKRAITPALYVASGVRPGYDDGWDFEPVDFPLIEIVDITSESRDGQPTGLYTLTYRAGLDAKIDPTLRPIIRYVTAHALNAPEVTALWKKVTKPVGDVKSATTQGQSITYDKPTLGGGGQAGSGAPGALPSLASLDRWRLAGREAYQRRTPYQPPWPHSSMMGGLR